MYSAKVLKLSVAKDGQTVVTFELEYWRAIHAELMTHRLFSRNAASSRAIPIQKLIDMVKDNPAGPLHWGLNEPGMQASGTHSHVPTCEYTWRCAAENAVKSAESLKKLGLHKQIVNRVLEPFQTMKTVVTTTEVDNWFYLRDHEHAQPEIAHLARLMKDAYENAEAEYLVPGEWHVPYVETMRDKAGMLQYFVEEGGKTIMLTQEEAIKVSASCCAQVSYRVLDKGVDKALRIYDQLIESKPMHASPVEHQASPLRVKDPFHSLPKGVTAYNFSTQSPWSGNFQNWLQYRQTLDNHTNWDYTK